jgi:hypothetical protein
MASSIADAGAGREERQGQKATATMIILFLNRDASNCRIKEG